MSYCYLTHKDRSMVCVPSKMADGRMLTDYRSASLIDVQLQNQVKSSNQYEYRQHLIDNGRKIARTQNANARQTVMAGNAKKPNQTKKVRERYMTVCEGNRCRVVEVNPKGVGMGRHPTSSWTPITPDASFLASFDEESGPSLYKTVQ